MRILILLLLIIIYLPPSFAYYEKDYQNAWCTQNNGATEITLYDKTRVDCVTKTHAIEFDFAKKWKEAIGQSLYYSIVLKKIPGIVLIIEDPQKDSKYIKRLQKVTDKYNITVWTITPDYLVQN